MEEKKDKREMINLWLHFFSIAAGEVVIVGVELVGGRDLSFGVIIVVETILVIVLILL